MEYKNVVSLSFTIQELRDQNVFKNTESACIGGRSQIRSSSERMGTLSEDNLIGQVCHYAASVFLTGSTESYHYARDKANANPYAGDGGSDIPGFKVDIKGSLMRRSPEPLSYRLLVRPAEKHDNWCYILVLASLQTIDSYTVYLVGGATTDMLPKDVEKDGIFKGAYLLPATSLKSIKGCKGSLKDWRDRVND